VPQQQQTHQPAAPAQPAAEPVATTTVAPAQAQSQQQAQAQTQQQPQGSDQQQAPETAPAPAPAPVQADDATAQAAAPQQATVQQASGQPAAQPEVQAQRADAPAAPAATPAAQAAAAPVAEAARPVEPAAPRELPQLHGRAHLSNLHEVADTMIRIGARQGRTEANIKLNPEELGQVQIRLTYHSGGVSAHLTAESAQAVQALVETASELRRSLESQGLVVHDLDVRQDGAQARDDAREGFGAPRRGDGSRAGLTAEPEQAEIVIDPSTLPRAGSSVDVLA
jgi:flagellar hook-length control protein FliK